MNFLAADGAPNAPFGPWLGPRKNAAECRNGPATHPSITFTRRAKAKKEEIEEEEEEEERRKKRKKNGKITGLADGFHPIGLGFTGVCTGSEFE